MDCCHVLVGDAEFSTLSMQDLSTCNL